MIKIKNKTRFLKIFWSIIIIPPTLLAIFLLSVGFGAFGKLPTFEELENPKSNISTEIISEDGVLIGSFFIENRSFVDYRDLSPHLVAALVATEDSRFYSHSGVDFISLARVAFKTVLMGQNQGGGSTISQQLAKNLYPRDTTVYSSSVSRASSVVLAKMKEWITSVMLEYNYTKEEITVMYLNVVAYGSNAFGIKSAAQTFFGKSPYELTVEESAMLVGVVNAPTRFSPVRNPDNALKRRNTVIERLYSGGYLNRHQRDSISALPITLNYNPISHDEGLATYFRTMLSQYMTASEPKRKNFYNDWDFTTAQNLWSNDPLYGWCIKNQKTDGTSYNIYRDGLKIYTTINSKMQRYAEEAVNENMSESVQPRFTAQVKRTGSTFFNLSNDEKNQIIMRSVKQSDRFRVMKNEGISESDIMANFKKPTDMSVFAYNKQRGIDTLMTPMDSILYAKSYLRAGFVAVEPSSGYVKAYVGGVNHRFFKYDMASQGKRQAGSTFKPFVYTFAIDQLGLSPCQNVPNSPVTVDGWSPKEAGNVEQIGELRPLWWGLAMSRNNFSAWIMKQANQPKAVAEFINRLGISSFIDPVAPLCLGSADVSLFEMVGAYTNFVNNGVHIEPIFVTRIEDKHGNMLATFSPRSSDAISSQSAYTMLSMLQKVVNSGTAGRLRHMYKFTGEMGGKTGTSNKNADSWFIGITPKIVAGSWIGGEDRSTHFVSGGEGSVVSLPAYARFLKKVYGDPSLGVTEKDTFIRPVGATAIDCASTINESDAVEPQALIDEDGFFE